MRKILFLALAAISAPAFAQSGHLVQGYVRSDGTYVAPHYQSNSDGTKLNNYGTQGNVNPYTGRTGTVNPYAPTQRNPYGNPNNTRPLGTPNPALPTNPW